VRRVRRYNKFGSGKSRAPQSYNSICYCKAEGSALTIGFAIVRAEPLGLTIGFAFVSARGSARGTALAIAFPTVGSEPLRPTVALLL
jgi:hypothetical protein